MTNSTSLSHSLIFTIDALYLEAFIIHNDSVAAGLQRKRVPVPAILTVAYICWAEKNYNGKKVCLFFVFDSVFVTSLRNINIDFKDKSNGVYYKNLCHGF